MAAAVACKAQITRVFGCFEKRAKSKSRLSLTLRCQVARLAALSEDDYVGQAARLVRGAEQLAVQSHWHRHFFHLVERFYSSLFLIFTENKQILSKSNRVCGRADSSTKLLRADVHFTLYVVLELI